jgi:hypothetical protein
MSEQFSVGASNQTRKEINNMSNTTDNPAVTFHDDFQALRAKYPMVYLEAWTPDDFVFDPDKDDDDDDTTPAPVDWNHPFHEITADNLHRHFDAEFGTNWDRIREESVSK